MSRILLLLFFITASKPYNEQERLENTHVPQSSRELMTYSSYTNHPCYRLCKKNDKRTCYFNIVIDTYQTKADCRNCPENKIDCYRPHCITTDGTPTNLLTYNYMLPGPILSVCEGDTIVVHATNYLSEGTTIHHHGFSMWATPFMDGVPYETQYPINPFTTFVYNFYADRSGTLWYHSHFGTQRGFGLFAALIVRVPDELNPLRRCYDVDSNRHVIVLCDWRINFNATAINVLINGRGHDQKREYNPPIYSKFNVYQNKRYRFRMVFAGTASCSLEVSIHNHTLEVISVDGNDIEKIEVTSIVIMPAQRFDFIVKAKQKIDNYWIVVRGLTGCANMTNGAILHYENAPDSIPNGDLNYDDIPEGIQVNTLDAVNLDNPDHRPVYTLESLLKKFPPSVESCRIYLTIDSIINNGSFAARINKISGTSSDKVSIIHAKNYLTDAFFCNSTSLKNDGVDCGSSFCQCRHKIDLPYDTYCEIFIVNDMTIQHPIHFHGFTFRVLGAGKLTTDEINDVSICGVFGYSLTALPFSDRKCR